MDVEEALNFADDLVFNKTGQRLIQLQKDILRGSLSGQTYSDIKKNAAKGYQVSYLARDVGNDLWKLLTEVLQGEGVLEKGEKVGKKNVWERLERAFKQYESDRNSTQYGGDSPLELPKKVLPFPSSNKVEEAANDTPVWNPFQSRLEMAKQPISKGSNFAEPVNAIAKERFLWGEIPEFGIFYGRSEELAKLQQWLAGASRCRQVTIFGMGGIGKTALAARLAKQIQNEFEYVIWQNLRYAPPLPELLADLMQFLDNERVPNNQTSVLGSISRLMEFLRSHRCLIVLDEIETILQPGQPAGYYLPEYQDYGELIKRVGEIPHQSCLVLTSREIPKDVAFLQGETLPVRSLEVRGLKTEDAKGILEAKGFSWTDRGLEELIRLYRGHPAALMIVATTIKELFDGNISQFLQQSTLVVGDILGHLLNQQFQRLLPLEQDVMYWLAIAGNALSADELKAEMWGAIARSELLLALESIGRRSLIEKVVENGKSLFSLQPVLIKYVIDRLILRVGQEIFYVIDTQKLDKLGLLRSHNLFESRSRCSVSEIQVTPLSAISPQGEDENFSSPVPPAYFDVSRLLARIKDRLLRILTSERSIEEQLTSVQSMLAEKSPLELGYAEVNIRNLLAAIKAGGNGHD